MFTVHRIVKVHTVPFASVSQIEHKQTCEIIHRNPFQNLLEMARFYADASHCRDSKKMEGLISGLAPDPIYVDHNIDMISYYQCFITSMYLSTIDPAPDDPWLVFDQSELNELLTDSFFAEYHRYFDSLKLAYKRKYPMLEVYCYAKLQSVAASFLPKDVSYDINYVWCYEDFIELLYQLEWNEIIGEVYSAYGMHWFTENAETDPIRYKWACYAIAACHKSGMFSDELLKQDLANIYQELLIALTIRNTLDKNAEIVNYVKDCIIHFDTEKINRLIQNVKTLEEQHHQLIDANTQLHEGLDLLRKQLKEIQSSSEKNVSDIVEEMAYRIYCLSPQNDDLDSNVLSFKNIWDRLSTSTKKDLKISLSMFEQYQSVDLALFPMIRSLEHELARNFFEPFHRSKLYQEANKKKCSNAFYQQTHDSLLKRNNSHPTLGNIPYIGKAISDDAGRKASKLIEAFSVFLSDNQVFFEEICRQLDTYTIGLQHYRLVDLRNGIAHGNEAITNSIDNHCYLEVSKLLYEPPIQILFAIIEHSMLS